MDGLNLDMLGTEEVEKLFSDNGENGESQEPEEQESGEKEETAEVDFSDLGITPESVGRGESEEHGEAPAPKSAGTQNQNLFFSIAKALRDEGVFPDLSDDSLSEIKDASDFRKMFEDQVSSSMDERVRRIETAINGGATSEEVQQYQNDMQIFQNLYSKQVQDLVEQEGDDGENLRRQILEGDYLNRGFSQERVKKLVEKSFADGTDIDDAKEALESLKGFYGKKMEGYDRMYKQKRADAEKRLQEEASAFQKEMLDTEDLMGISVDKGTRQRAYDAIAKPKYKTEDGRMLTEMQKYQEEHPREWHKNLALMFALTDGFRNIDKLVKTKVKAGMKKGYAELESVLNNTRRTSDGKLDLANTMPEDNGRENWTLAI